MCSDIKVRVFINHFLKIFFQATLLYFLSSGAFLAEEFSFNLSTKGITFGSFKMTAKSDAKRYKISSVFESTGILGAFTRIRVVSGAHGKIGATDNLDLRPLEVLSKWQSLINKKQSKIRYKDNKIIHYEVLPKARNNLYAIDPFRLRGVIDPLTVTFWMLKSRTFDQLCRGKKLVSEGQSVLSVHFLAKNEIDDLVHCQGQFEFLKGFDPTKYKKTKYFFNLTYAKSKQNRNIWNVKSMSFDTRIGLIKALRTR
jgi:hypothetical protein